MRHEVSGKLTTAAWKRIGSGSRTPTMVLLAAQLVVAGCAPSPDAATHGANAPADAPAAEFATAPGGDAAGAPAATSSLPTGRYKCYLMGQESISIAADLNIEAGNQYELGGGSGSYEYAAGTGSIRWVDGPLHQPTEEWVGVFTAKGSATPLGGTTVGDIIEVRRAADVSAGNARVLQECTRAE